MTLSRVCSPPPQLAPIAASAALFTLAACGTGDGARLPAGASPPASMADADAADARRYVVFSTIEAPENRIGYFALTSSIDGDVPIDISSGIEEPGGGRLYVEPGVGTFMIGGGETPTITRYDVAADGALTRGIVLSFANQGVSDLADGALVFVNSSKAYLRDRSQLQLISFDPTAMRVLDVLPLDGVARDGLVADFGQAIQRDDGIYFPMSYSDPDEAWSRAPEGAVLVHVDPQTDRISVSSDERCTTMNVGLLAEDGDAYWFSDRANTFGWRADPPSPGARHDCALRLRAGETTFDPAWSLDLTTRTNGWPALAAVPAGGAKLWLRVLEESTTPVPPGATPLDVEALEGWQWYLLDLDGAAAASRNDERPAGSYYTYDFRVDGRTFTTENDADYTETTLLELDELGFRAGPTLAGTVRGLARLR